MHYKSKVWVSATGEQGTCGFVSLKLYQDSEPECSNEIGAFNLIWST